MVLFMMCEIVSNERQLCIGDWVISLLLAQREERINAFKTEVKKSENSKIKILFIDWSQCLNSYTTKLRMII